VIGVQGFTLREYMKTIPDMAAAFKRIRDIGYTTVQLSGCWPADAKEVAAALADTGLRAVSTHIPFERFLNELDTVIEEHAMWNCPHPAIGSLDRAYHSEAGIKRFIEEVTPISAKLAEAGMDFSYHNHSRELARYGDRTWLAALYEDAPASVVKAEIDTYWITAGGGDPAQWIRRYPGRQPILHLKDMIVTQEKEQRFAPIGEGNLNWEAILAAAESSGVEYAMVEQDQCYGEDPFACLATSYRNLKAMGCE
jgi:sugar phosphate isomerase/epimerase